MTATFGIKSKLDITTHCKNGKSYIRDVYFSAPFKIAKPFEQEDGGIKIIIMSASAGIMEGDVQEIDIKVLEDSKVNISSQSFEKIHRMNNKEARRNCNIQIHKNAYLKYMPLPTIPFAESAFNSVININLFDDTSRLIMTDIISCGRYARGEKFEYRCYKSLINITRMGELLLKDNTVFEPQKFPMNDFGMFEEYTHLANIYLFNLHITEDKLSKLREILKNNDMDGNASFTWSNDVTMRIFGSSAESLLNITEKVISIVE